MQICFYFMRSPTSYLAGLMTGRAAALWDLSQQRHIQRKLSD